MSELTKTALLLNRIVDGDQAASNELVKHCYPMLLRWAHGRIPASEKSLIETTDMVQETLLKGLNKAKNFKAIRAGSFLAYLRKIFINCVNDNIRKSKPTLTIDGLENYKTEFIIDTDSEDFIAYEEALNKLSVDEYEVIVLRVEFGFTFQELAEAMEKPSEDAARMAFKRALAKLTSLLKP